ncbi:hypothetical protein D9M68_958490 [compost metagenome]
MIGGRIRCRLTAGLKAVDLLQRRHALIGLLLGRCSHQLSDAGDESGLRLAFLAKLIDAFLEQSHGTARNLLRLNASGVELRQFELTLR